MEVLVALLVLSIGLLGLAALQTQGLRFNNEAYYRTQATALAYEVIDLMRATRNNAAQLAQFQKDTATLGGLDADDCASDSVNVDVQLSCWMGRLRDSLPGAAASIAANTAVAGRTGYVDVTISWVDRDLSTGTIDTAATQERCESQTSRTWDDSGATPVCRINQVWTVFP